MKEFSHTISFVQKVWKNGIFNIKRGRKSTCTKCHQVKDNYLYTKRYLRLSLGVTIFYVGKYLIE